MVEHGAANSKSAASRGGEVACPRCGVAFACDPGGACWCAALPLRLKLPESADARCWCPACLAESARLTVDNAGRKDAGNENGEEA